MKTGPWTRYESYPSFLLGFHGCDRTVGEALLNGKKRHLRPSENDYDWLGHGIYFWESSPNRALEFAKERARGGNNSRGSIKDPFVVGAIIDPRHCLNLMDVSALQEVRAAYLEMKGVFRFAGAELPGNGKALGFRHTTRIVVLPG